MLNETAARAAAPQQDVQEESDYDALCAALSASARGRAFLAEYTRRNRNADTGLLLSAIDRLQKLVAANKRAAATGSVKALINSLLAEVSAARSGLETGVFSLTATKFAELLAMIERRLAIIVGSPGADHGSAEQLAHIFDAQSEKTARTHLAVVPLSDQPELPIPSPVAASPSIALVHSKALMAEIAFLEPSPASPEGFEPQPVITDIPGVEPAVAPVSKAVPRATSADPSPDPLASIKSLSEEERLALFS